MSKVVSKYFAFFDYFDKTLIVLSETSGTISISSFAAAIKAPGGIASARFSFAFSVTKGIVTKLSKTTQLKIKGKIIMKLLYCLEVN